MKFAFYPGCSLEASARDFDRSTRALCSALGVELEPAEGDQMRAKQHGVDYLVTSIEHCLQRSHDFAADPWQWMVYETQDVKTAAALFAQGIDYVESNDICAVLGYGDKTG